MWQSVADGGSRIEVDEESYSRQRRSWTPLPRIVVERAPEVEPRRFYVLSAESYGRATKPHNDECRERIRTIIESTLMGKARMNAYRDRIVETEGVIERERARV